MIGFHLQGNVNNWPSAAFNLPNFSPIKFTDGGPQRAVEAKGINKTLYTVVRHVVQEQNPQGDFHQHARDFFAKFVDETFRTHARAVNAICEYNEYFANSQNQDERNKWISWAQACVDVWRDDYRTQSEYAHIDLVIAETAIGNDIPWELAKLSHDNAWVLLGYHPYVPVWKGVIRPDEWTWYSGRWEKMDADYRSKGYIVRWFFGEFGAIGHNGPGWPNSLACNDGWKHSNVYNGNLDAYIVMINYWMEKAQCTNAWLTGRVFGAVIFTSGGGDRWKYFELAQPDLGIVASAVKQFTPGQPPAPLPPPQTTPCRGNPRIQYQRTYLTVPQEASFEQWLSVCKFAYENKQTCGFSYDDAGVGDLDNRTAVLYGLSPYQEPIFANWFKTQYPKVNVIFRDFPAIPVSFYLTNQPCNMSHITQVYGVNPERYEEFGLPYHMGIDFGLNQDAPIYNAAAGTVVLANRNADSSPFGIYCIIQHNDLWRTIYAHLNVLIIQAGDVLPRGTHLGGAGSTGNSTGIHLHFQLEKNGCALDPWPYLEPLL